MNPNSYQHHRHHPPPRFPNPHFPIPNPPHNLSTALSALTDLIQLTERTLSSAPLNHLLVKDVDDEDDAFAHCPYNPTHRMPACSLFTHYLTCPNSLDLNHLLSSLRYPHTLKSSRSEQVERPADDSLHELCFSVDGYGDFNANYFYKDCPGVVSLLQERDGEKRAVTVPRVLFMECKDVTLTGDDELREFENGGFKLLVGEFWLGRCEVEGWNDYPGRCSIRVLKMISNVCAMNDLELKKWVIENSPSYGVVIDKAMRDHITLLLKLCLRQMAKEANRLVKLQLCSRGSEGKGESNNYMDISFDCKFMNEVLGWFISQLTVLYGEVNGKHYGINMLKNCIVKAGTHSLFFPLEEKDRESHDSNESLQNLNNHECEISESGVNLARKHYVESEMSGNVLDEILLSQVAAAVTALYERMILERKIRGFRPPQPLPKNQIIAEHDYLTNKAREERQKRPNYRSIVEHDGLMWQHSHNQETNRKKTKEELLAEERDYKRRRLSYRGKKMKRSTTEVMRGIIEEYMEEIKHTGGIGCLVKGFGEAKSFPHEPAHIEYLNAKGIRSGSYDVSGKRRQPNSINTPPHPLDDRCESVQSLSKDYKRQNSEAYQYVEHFENHRNSSSSNRHDRDHSSRSRSSSKGGSQRWSEDRTHRRIDHKEIIKPRHDFISYDTSSDWKSRSVSSSSSSRMNTTDELEFRQVGQRNANTRYGIHSVSSDTFGDRYNPAFSDRYDPSISRTVLEDEDVT